MCGFCGEITFDGTHASVEAVNRMTRTLAPRGPDGAGVHAHGSMALGHRRLKIIDLSDRAQQPMTGVMLLQNRRWTCLRSKSRLRWLKGSI